MGRFGSDGAKDAVILLSRILLAVLFLIFGTMKVTHYAATAGSFAQTGVPLPEVATLVAIIMEVLVSGLIVLGIFTRPLAVLMAVYVLATGFIGHPYWTMTGAAQMGAMINFYKNISIIGGFLLLYVTGAGKYSIDAKLRLL
jgi:putative oxidoreductase